MNYLTQLRKEVIILMESLSYKMDDSVMETLEQIKLMNTEDAIDYLAKFVEEHKYGGCIHLAAWLHKKYPEKITFGFVPYTDPNTGKKSSKFINILLHEDTYYVIDMVTPLETGHNSIVSLLFYFIGVPSSTYITENYTAVDELTILPNPYTTNAANQPFVDFCFKNAQTINVSF